MHLPALRLAAVSLAAALLSVSVRADVRVPTVISDHMVLQAETPANVWGWAEPGEKVTVKFGSQTKETATSPEGTYLIDGTVLDNNNKLTNYIRTVNPGVLTIGKVVLSVD